MRQQGMPSELFLAVIVAMVLGVAYFVEHDRLRRIQEEAARVEEVVVAAYTQKRASEVLGDDDDDEEDAGGRKKRAYHKWERDRARLAVHKDHWGSPTPLFNGRMFQRVFRVTRQIAQMILDHCCQTDEFFHDKPDALGRPGICPKVKILMALKILAYGCSPSAFQDYFQMGVSTACLCLLKMCRALASNTDLHVIYMRDMWRSDAARVSAAHCQEHGVIGQLGSLDCMHVGWKNCPVAWQGQETGKESSPTIVLEAMCDHNLWFWHTSFGWAGSLNDINIWERSSLLKKMVDGTMAHNLDFTYNIAGQEFNKLWIAVDGIYPELSRFVKTIQEPTTEGASMYAKWQESSRKDIERAFGVLQRKFHYLVKPVEQWYVEDIGDMVTTCLILHNAMVAHRVQTNTKENVDFYDAPTNDIDLPPPAHQLEEEAVNCLNAEMEALRAMEESTAAVDVIPLYTQQKRKKQSHSTQLQYTHQRWEGLYDPVEHDWLRRAIIQQLQMNREDYRATLAEELKDD